MNPEEIESYVDEIRWNPSEVFRLGRSHPAVRALAKGGAPALALVLSKMCTSPSPRDVHPKDIYEAMQVVLSAMARHDSDLVVSAFQSRRQKRPSAQIREERSSLIDALGYAEPNAVIDTLLEALDDRDWSVRYSAVQALLRSRHPRSKPSIFRAILDRDSLIRFCVVEAVRKDKFFREAAAIPALRKLLKDERLKKRHPGTWEDTNEALAKIKEEQGSKGKPAQTRRRARHR